VRGKFFSLYFFEVQMKMKYLLIAAVLLLLPSLVSAQGVPDVKNATTFEGSVSINGAIAPDDTCITASGGGGGTDCPGSEGGGTKNGIYSIPVIYQGTPETISFSINGNKADQIWQLKESDKGKVRRLDLTVTVTVTTPSGGVGSGSGGGGGGVITAEPFENILMYLTVDGNLIANTPVPFSFSSMPPLGIYEIPVTGMENENFVSIRVELLKGTSKLVTSSPPGLLYKNVNIWASSRRVKEALVRFKIENSWLDNNSLAGSDVKMQRWDGNIWKPLETSEISKDSTYTYFEAKTPGFSPFAISAKVPAITPTVTGPTPTVTPPLPSPTVTATKPGPTPMPSGISGWIYALIVIVIIAGAAYYFLVMKKKEEKKEKIKEK